MRWVRGICVSLLICSGLCAQSGHNEASDSNAIARAAFTPLIEAVAKSIPNGAKTTDTALRILHADGKGMKEIAKLNAEEAQSFVRALAYLREYSEKLDTSCLSKTTPNLRSRSTVLLAKLLADYSKMIAVKENTCELNPQDLECTMVAITSLLDYRNFKWANRTELFGKHDAKLKTALYVSASLMRQSGCLKVNEKLAQQLAEAFSAENDKLCHFQDHIDSENRPQLSMDDVELYTKDEHGEFSKLVKKGNELPSIPDGTELLVKGKFTKNGDRIRSLDWEMQFKEKDRRLIFSPKYDSATGEFEGTLQIPKHSVKGELIPRTIYLKTESGAMQLPDVTTKALLSVQSKDPDDKAPESKGEVTFFHRSPKGDWIPQNAPVTKDGKIFAKVDVRDDKAGLKTVSLVTTDVNGKYRRHEADFKRHPYDEKNGLATIEISLPPHLAKDNFKVVYVNLEDRTGNTKLLEPSGIEFGHEQSDPDTASPNVDLKTFEMVASRKGHSTPLSSNPSKAEMVLPGDTVTWKMNVKDNKSGLDTAKMWLIDPASENIYQTIHGKLTPNKDGSSTAEFSVPISRTMPYGKYIVRSIEFADKTGNLLQDHLMTANEVRESPKGIGAILGTGFVVQGPQDKGAPLPLSALQTVAPTPQRFDELITQLGDTNSHVRDQALSQLYGYGQSVRAPLNRIFESVHPDPEVQARIRSVLQRLDARHFP